LKETVNELIKLEGPKYKGTKQSSNQLPEHPKKSLKNPDSNTKKINKEEHEEKKILKKNQENVDKN